MTTQPVKSHPGPRRQPAGRQALFPIVSCAISALMVVAAVARAAQSQSQTEEYRVKAALLFHFAELVDWPVNAFATDTSPITICTIGQDPFDGELETSLNGKSIGARAIRILHLKEPRDLAGCQMLFVGSNENKRVPSVLAEVGKAPIMTVGESDGFLEHGGMVRLDLEDGKIRFAVNLDASDQAGLKISSRLLLLAETVTGKHK